MNTGVEGGETAVKLARCGDVPGQGEDASLMRDEDPFLCPAVDALGA